MTIQRPSTKDIEAIVSSLKGQFSLMPLDYGRITRVLEATEVNPKSSALQFEIPLGGENGQYQTDHGGELEIDFVLRRLVKNYAEGYKENPMQIAAKRKYDEFIQKNLRRGFDADVIGREMRYNKPIRDLMTKSAGYGYVWSLLAYYDKKDKSLFDGASWIKLPVIIIPGPMSSEERQAINLFQDSWQVPSKMEVLREIEDAARI